MTNGDLNIRDELIATGISDKQLEKILSIFARNTSSQPSSKKQNSTYGMDVGPVEKVRLLRQILKDSYKTDFCIFQELLQNADDASAENILIGVSNGLSALHPLTNVPALFFINDGPVSEKNLNAIKRVAGSDKNEDGHKIGKFGLGMKSIFHIADAFLCFGGGENNFSPRLVTPWENPQWEEKWYEESEVLAKIVEQILPQQVLKWKQWFCIWIPLRQMDSANNTQTIIQEYPKLSNFMQQAYFERSSELLPMLKNVKTLLFVENGEVIYELGLFSIKRMTGVSDGFFGGHAKVGKNTAYNFIGQEFINNDEVFKRLQESIYWPKQLTTTYEIDDEKTSDVKDKNLPHTAICIIKIPAKDNNAKLFVNQCVFLPLSDKSDNDKIKDSPYSYILNLHGYYFIDAGRQGLDVKNIELEDISQEQELTACWNKILQEKGIFHRLIPMLDYCLREWSEQDIDEIMKSLRKIDFIRENLASICYEQFFVKVLCKTGLHWQALPKKTKIYEMPIPAFGKLREFLASSTEYVITDKSTSGLKYSYASNSSDINGFISFVFQCLNAIPVDDIFTQENHDFLFDFFEMLRKSKNLDEAFIFWKRFIHESKIENYSSFMSAHSHYMMATPELFSFINETSSIDKTVKNISVWKYLTSDTKEKILILKDNNLNLSDIGDNDFDTGDIQSILSLLQNLSDEDAQSPIAKKLLHACFSHVSFEELPDEFSTYPYWRIDDKKYSAYQLKNMAADKHLCTGNSRLVNIFQQAVKWEFLSISHDLVNLLDLDVNEFSEETVVDIISECPELNDAEKRVDLLDILLHSKDFMDDRKHACRYLLHGKPELYDYDGDLLSPLNGVFFTFSQKIVEIITKAECPVSYSLPEELLKRLDFYREKLGILSNSPNSLIRKLASLKSDISFEALPDNSWELLLKMTDFSEKDMYAIVKSIPIFHTTDEELTALYDSCYLIGGVEVPDILRADIKCIKQSADKIVSEKLNQLVSFWNNKTALRYCTRHPFTEKMDGIILRGLKAYFSDGLPGNVYQYLNSENWVLLKDGRRVSANHINILSSFKELSKALQRDYAHCDDVQFSEIKDLLKHFQLHLNKEESLSTIFKLMQTCDDYNIGRLGLLRENINFSCQLLCKFFSVIEDMPIVTMISSLRNEGIKDEAIDYQIKFFFKMIPQTRLVRLINSLSDLMGDPAKRKAEINYYYLFLINYLDEAVDYPEFLQTIVGNLYLYNENHKLKSCKELCFHAYNVCSDYQLNGDYKTQGRFWKHLCGRESQGKVNGKETLLTLQEYFDDWDAALEGRFAERIAGFMICCTDDPKIMRFVKSNLGFQYRDIEETRGELHPELNRLLINKRVVIQANTTKDIEVVALDGSHFIAPLNSLGDSEDLFVGNGGACGFVSEKQAVHLRNFNKLSSPEVMGNIDSGSIYLHLRKPTKEELKALDESKLDSMLKETLAKILEFIAPKILMNLDSFWDSVSHGEQLDIHVTRNILLQHAPMYLRILRCKHPSIDTIFKELHAEEYVREEATRNKNWQRIRQSQDKTDTLLQQLCDLIKDKNSNVSKCILDALQSQIRNTYNYSEDSILFELFQNADDASEELRSLYSDMQPEYHDQFIVRFNNDCLIIVNYGRMVNQIRVPGIKTKQDVSGFQRDLEKMILLSQSDKELENLNVVGKFGLGFKSVFLVSERPLIFSGRLRFCIEGGFLPQTLSDKEIEYYSGIIKEYSEHTEIHPTVIILPIIQQKIELLKQAINRFNEHIKLLTLFSKRIKRITIISENVNNDYSLPENINKEYLYFPFEQQYFVFMTKYAQFLFGFKDGYINPLNDKISTFWATSPTSINLGLGFAVNSNFDLDTGRKNMNLSSNTNKTLVNEISNALFELLTKLWNDLKLKIQETNNDIEGNTIFYHYMMNIWTVFTNGKNSSRWFLEQQDKSINLLKEIIWNTKCDSGYSQFLLTYPVIPSGLPGRFMRLCKYKNIKYSFTENLISSGLWQLADENAFIPGTVVANNDIAKLLDKFINKSKNIEIYDCETLLQSLLKRFPCLLPSFFEGDIGHILCSGLENLRCNDYQTVSNEELRNILRKFMFVNQAHEKAYAMDLLIAGADSSDESLKASFAPRENILNSSYNQSAINLLKFIRIEIQIQPERLARWAVNASNKKEQEGVLNYVLKADNTKSFCEKIIALKENTWIERLNTNEVFKALPQEQRLIIIGKFKLSPSKFGIYDRSDAQDDLGVLLHLNFIDERDPCFFQKVYDFWCENHEKGTRSYNKLMYNREDVEPLLFETDTLEQRSQWMELLLLGACHTLGLRLSQHSGFIKFLKDKGYWNVYCKPGDINPDEWLDTLDKFLDAEELNDGEYAHWMKLFMRIFQFAKYLDDYVEIFSWWNEPGKIPRSRYELTNVRRNPLLSGTGITPPGLNKALGSRVATGLHFVFREMVRRKALTKNDGIFQYCYVPYKNVSEIADSNRDSEDIYRRVAAEIGFQKATFLNDFDIAILKYRKEF